MESSWEIGGRLRSTTKLAVMKTMTSSTSAPARSAGSAHRRHRTMNTTESTTVAAIFTEDSARPLPTHVRSFHVEVR